MTAVKIIRVIGTSEESWEAAAEEALERASESVEDISGLSVESWTATVGSDGIEEYKTTVELAFPVRQNLT